MSEVWPPLAAILQAAQEYPMWICADCGEKYGKRPFGIATWHRDTCGVCGRVTGCTEPRDVGHLKDGWQAHGSYNTDDGKWTS
jgi:hypothetical protein